MTKEARNSNDEIQFQRFGVSSLGFLSSFVIRHLDFLRPFVIRYRSFALLRIVCIVAIFLACASSHGALYSTTFSVNSAIPDGNASGLQSSFTLSGLNSQVTDINVTLNISGGW